MSLIASVGATDASIGELLARRGRFHRRAQALEATWHERVSPQRASSSPFTSTIVNMVRAGRLPSDPLVSVTFSVVWTLHEWRRTRSLMRLRSPAAANCPVVAVRSRVNPRSCGGVRTTRGAGRSSRTLELLIFGFFFERAFTAGIHLILPQEGGGRTRRWLESVLTCLEGSASLEVVFSPAPSKFPLLK
jgi:hypothetical protein